ncbi:hypothetical protein GA0115246_112102 [Streptomyces sp. SolWspMP-sol7th]|nr:hypothetical protein GA0115246_112102 [Streptomyces sp. SolWspMP-sol7th]
MLSAPAPCAARVRARASTRASSSAYVSEAPSKTSAVASGVRAAWARNASGSVTSGPASSVAFHAVRTRERSSSRRTSSVASGASGAATACSRSETRRSPRSAAVRASKRSALYSIQPWMPPPSPCSTKSKLRSNFAVSWPTLSRREASPGRSGASAPSPARCTTITWKSGCRASERAGCRASTRRSKGRSWWA